MERKVKRKHTLQYENDIPAKERIKKENTQIKAQTTIIYEKRTKFYRRKKYLRLRRRNTTWR